MAVVAFLDGHDGRAFGGAVHAVRGTPEPVPFPECPEVSGILHAELDVEETVQRHG